MVDLIEVGNLNVRSGLDDLDTSIVNENIYVRPKGGDGLGDNYFGAFRIVQVGSYADAI